RTDESRSFESSSEPSALHHVADRDRGGHEGQEAQERRNRGGRPEVELDECLAIHLQREDVCGAPYTPIWTRRSKDEIEDFQFPQDAHRDDDDRHRFQEGKGYLSECTQGRSAVELRGFPVFFRNRREAGGIDDQAEAGPKPDGSENQAEEERRGSLQP